MSTQAGGSANIRGVIYQMLWSLLEASELVLEGVDAQALEDGTAPGYLIVEPREGGGDDRLFKRDKTFIQQLKAKADSGTWSLRSLVEEVLPDLFKAIEDHPSGTFQLVTEGRIGEWEEADNFFRSLAGTPPGDDVADVLQLLDDSAPINFSGSLPT